MRFILLAALLCGSAAGLFAQAMIEHAAAAAGGSVGGVAGKKVSDGISSILGKVDSQAKTAAKDAGKGKRPDPNAPLVEVGTPQVVAHPPAAGSPLAGGPGPAAAAPRGPAAPISRVAQNHGASAAPVGPQLAPLAQDPAAPTASTAAISGAAAPEPPLTREMLTSIKAGASREEVLGKLGTPTSRITMYEEDGALEVLRFSRNRDSLGVVRLINGKVTEVILNEQ
jgi:hypothetical protein